jgi:hypothetical protein
MKRRRVMWAVAILIVSYGLFLAAAFSIMRQPPERFGTVMRHVPMPLMALVPFESLWNVARGGSLRVGDVSPDFTLPTADTQSEMRLASFRGRMPVVLVFGSYT